VCFADLDQDGDVDEVDLALIVADWLESSSPADIYPQPAGDGIVDLQDFALFAQYWLDVVAE
jgi:hypothetical protein